MSVRTGPARRRAPCVGRAGAARVQRWALAWLLVAAMAPAAAQPGPSAQASPSLYAVNAAGLAAAMTYCTTRHGALREGSPGEACYREARRLLAGMDLRGWARDIDRGCSDPATYNRCMTPQIGRLVYALNDAFTESGL